MRATRAIALSLALAIGVAACGGDDTSSDTTTTKVTSPEEHLASAAEVTAGLHDIDAIVTSIATSVNADDGKAATIEPQIEEAWKRIEGTVKANDPNAYLTFEEAFGLVGTAIEQSDGPGATAAATRVSTAVSAYLAAYPG